MTTVRDLCCVLSSALQVCGVEKFAARLMCDGYLPRAGDEVDEQDAAILILAVAVAPDPSQASHVIDTLMALRLQSMSCDLVSMTFPATDGERAFMPATVVEAVTETLECGIYNPVPGFQLIGLNVEQGGLSLNLTAFVRIPGEVRTYHAVYGGIEVPAVGLRTFVEIPFTVFGSVAAALQSRTEQRWRVAMPSLVAH